MKPDNLEAQRLLLDMAIREACRRTKKKNPPAAALIEVLDELGFKLTVASPEPVR